MGCSREEGLHLSSFHECKIFIISLIEIGRKKSDNILVRVLLLFCYPAAVLHVLCQASLIRAARVYSNNVTPKVHAKHVGVLVSVLTIKYKDSVNVIHYPGLFFLLS